MANELKELFGNIAAAIREKTGEEGTMKPSKFPEKISALPESVETTVNLDFSSGDMEVTPAEGKVFEKVSIPAPTNLIPENIAEGVDIAGIVGSLELNTGSAGVEYTLNNAGEIIKAKIVGLSTIAGCAQIKTLQEVDISGVAGCEELPMYAFYGCSNLKSIPFPEGIKRIMMYAIYSCSDITSLVIPDGVESIDNYGVANCRALTSITLPDGLLSIGDYGIYGNVSLNKVVIPASVNKIGKAAFFSCNALTNVIFENPDGWWYADSADATSGTSLPNGNLKNPATAASWLKSTYVYKYWFRT